MIIHFENLEKLKDGVKCKKNKDRLKIINKRLIGGTPLIGVLGQFNSGKTFLLSRLLKNNYSHGYINKTVGFNFIIEEDIKYVNRIKSDALDRAT